MAYKTLYRKYRPNNFADVSGQTIIVKTLKNAIMTNKINHAYLFNGTRGTGKTTIAKIFAKNVNCLNMQDGIPCGKCEICLTENTDEIQDIIEIDAASNNGVDEIRELKNKIKLVPVFCKYKVYIIDEVHMLSTGAFNALLKTLEEPPEYVIFILATTEPQKLPITIISRCQRFDFKKLSTADIENRLLYIANKENIKITSDSISEIAKISDGAMRDAIGILDQVSSFTNKEISIDDIYQISGKVSHKLLYELINFYIEKDVNKMLELIETVYIEGKDFKKLSADILMFFRNVFIYKKAPIYFENKEMSIKNQVIDVSKKISETETEKIITLFEKLSSEIKESDFPRILFEIYLLKNTNQNEKSAETETSENKKIIKSKEIETKSINTELLNIKIEKNEYTNETKIDFDGKETGYKKALINNTIAGSTNKFKKDFETLFLNLNKYLINKKHKTAATILSDATIIAVSDDHLLLTYKYVSMVENNDKDLNKIASLIEVMTTKKYKIVAITNDAWKEIRPYYLKLKKEKGTISLLEEIEINYDNKLPNQDEQLFDDAINIFGSELIEMEG